MREVTVCNASGEQINSLVQWDKDVYIYIEDPELDSNAYEVHFFNMTMDEAYVMTATYANSVLKAKIPNDILTQPHAFVGFVRSGESGEDKSVCRFRINIIKRPRPASYIYDDDPDYVTFADVLAEAKKYVTKAASSASAAKTSETNANNYAYLAKSYLDSLESLIEEAHEVDDFIENYADIVEDLSIKYPVEDVVLDSSGNNLLDSDGNNIGSIVYITSTRYAINTAEEALELANNAIDSINDTDEDLSALAGTVESLDKKIDDTQTALNGKITTLQSSLIKIANRVTAIEDWISNLSTVTYDLGLITDSDGDSVLDSDGNSISTQAVLLAI